VILVYISKGTVFTGGYKSATKVVTRSDITRGQVLLIVFIDIQDIITAGHCLPHSVAVAVVAKSGRAAITGDGYEVVLPVTQVYQYIHEQFLFESSICGTYDEVNTSYRKN
jgi:hypothetical protein